MLTRWQPSNARMATFVISWMIMLSGGTLYAYSVYSDELKETLGFSQTETSTAVAIGNNGVYLFGLVSGAVFDRFGPRPLAIMAMIFTGIGYSLLGFTLRGDISTSNIYLVSFYYLLVGFGSSCSQVLCISTSSRNFKPELRGRISGILLGFVGLSAFFVTQVYDIFFAADEATGDFVIFMGFFAVVACFVGALTVRLLSEEEKVVANGDVRRVEESLNSERDSLLSPAAAGSSPSIKPLIPDMGIYQLAFSWRFWALFIEVVICSSVGLLYINNIGSMITARGYEENRSDSDIDSAKSLQVMLLSILNSFARIAFGSISDYTSKLYPDTPRIIWLFASFALIAISAGYIIYAAPSADGFTLPSIAIGASYGAMFTVATAFLAETFGMRYFGQNWGCMLVGVAIGGQVFSLVYGILYDAEADKQKDDISVGAASESEDSEEDCVGQDCYLSAMYIAFYGSLAGLCLVIVHVLAERREALLRNKI